MKKFFWMICVLPLLQACTTIQTISFDRLKGAEINFPDQIRRVGIVNDVPAINPMTSFANDSIDYLEADGKVAAEMLAQRIAASDYFDQVVICDSALRSKKDGQNLAYTLPQSKADELIRSLGVDVLFSIERVNIVLNKEGYWGYSENMMQVPMMDGIVSPVLVAYAYGRPNPMFIVNQTDTLCWEVNAKLTYEQIARESAEYAADVLSERLLPHWVETERFYFDGGNVEMRDAGVCLRENNWHDAANLWKQVYDSKKGKAKMRAAFNLALYSEMQNDYQQAMKYLDEALVIVGEESPEGSLIRLYRQQLEIHFKENQRLQIQMKRFE